MTGPKAGPKRLRGNRGFVTVGVAATVLIGSLALVFGAPEHSRLLSLLSGHGWLTTSQSGQVLLANGQTGQLDFRLDVGNTTGGQLDVVQSGQQALLVDQKTGDAGSIDVGNLKVVKEPNVHGVAAASFRTALGTAVDVSAATQVLPGPQGDFYVVHRQSGRIDVSDPVSDRTVGSAEAGSGLSPAVVAGNGSLWVERQQTGTMVGADYEHGSMHVQQVKNSVVAPGDDVLLSSVNGTPAVLDRSRGLFFLAPDGVPGTAVSLPRIVARQVVVAPELSGSVVPLAAPGKVILVRNGAAVIRTLNGRSGDQLGAPVSFAQKIYVPDLTEGSVIVLNDSGLQVGTPIQVAHGRAALTVSVQNGALFINDLDSDKAFSVTSSDQLISINKDNPDVPTTHTTPANTPTVAAPPVTPPLASVPRSGSAVPAGAPTPHSTLPASAPAAPGSPTAQAGNKSATVSWTAPATHGSPITGYTVGWTAGAGGSKTVQATKASVDITGLQNGTSYTFSIKARNAAGTGPAALTTPVTPTSTVPDPPTDVTASAQSDGSIKVTWNRATPQGHPISKYTVTASLSSGTALVPVTVTSGTSTTFTSQQGVVLGTSYTFTVTATNDVNGSSKPSSASAAVTASTAPFAVTSLEAIADGKGSVAVSWTCASSCSAGSPLTKFVVSLTPPVGSPVTVPASDQTKYATTLTGLTDETNYTVTVTAYNKAWGAGQPATYAVLTEGQPTATVSPSWNGLSLTLSVSMDAHGSTVTGCHVALTGPGGPLSKSTSAGCSSLSITVPYYAATYSGTLTITSKEFGTTNGANVMRTQSTPKPLTATAAPAFGSAPPTPAHPYSGASSASCASPSFSTSNCPNSVGAPRTVYAICYAIGTSINNGQSTGPTQGKITSDVWLDIRTFPSDPWMNALYFNPYTGVTAELQQC
jgi:hypothetical protein